MTQHDTEQPDSTASARQERYHVRMTVTWQRADGEQRTTTVDRYVQARDLDEAQLIAALEADPPQDIRFRVHDLDDIAIDIAPIASTNVEA